MKTTIDISDALLAEARKLAVRRKTTLRALVEAGLRQAIAEQKSQRAPFMLRDLSVKGRGLRPELQAAGWDRLRELAYEDRGT